MIQTMFIGGCSVNKLNNSIESTNVKADILPFSPMEEEGVLRIGIQLNRHYTAIMRYAIELFEEKYDGWTVEYESYWNDKSLITVRDQDMYHLATKEKLQSGEFDLVKIDELRLPDLIEGGHIDDLTTYFDADPEMETDLLLAGVYAYLLETDGGLYRLPMNFETIALQTKGPTSISESGLEVAYTWEELADILPTELHSLGLEYLYSGNEHYMTLTLLSTYQPYLYDPQTYGYDLESPLLKAILDTVKLYYQRKLIKFYDPSLGRYTFEDCLLWITDAGMYLNDLSRFDNPDYIRFHPLPPMPGAEGKIAAFYESYAIGANSNNKRAAWEFMKILLSEDTQFNNPYIFYAFITREPVIADLSGAQIYAMKTGHTNYDETDEKYTDEQIIEFNRKRQQYYLDIKKERTNDGSLNTYIIHYAQKYYYDEITFEELRAYVKSMIEEVQSGIIPTLH